jgi:hypothetical protein
MFVKIETRKAKRRRKLAELLAQQAGPCTIQDKPADSLSFNEI